MLEMQIRHSRKVFADHESAMMAADAAIMRGLTFTP
jgi:hypothetical protein